MSEKKDMNSYFRERFGTDDVQKVQTKLGYEVTRDQDFNAYFVRKFGTHDLDQVQTKLDQARARGELPQGQPIVTVEKIIEKEVLTTRTPNWAQQDAILVTDVEAKTIHQIDAEIERQKVERAEKLRNKVILEADDAFYRVYGYPPQRTIEDPMKTLAKERAHAQNKSVNYVKDSIVLFDAKLTAIKNAPEATRKMVIQNQRAQYDFPDNPTQKLEIEKMVEKIMNAYAEFFEKMNKAVPYLEENRAMYQQVLQEKVQLQAAQQAKTPEILKEMEGFSKSAAKDLPKIVKVAGEYQEAEKENAMERLAVLVEEYLALQAKWMEKKRELYGLDPQPQFPPMPDLPVLPRKLWKKIQES